MDKYFWLKIVLNVFELLAFIAGLVCWKKIKHSHWKWFVLYCGVILLTELTAKYIGYVLKKPKLNGDIYFFFGLPFQFIFIFWLFSQWFEKKKDKLLPLILFILYVIAWIVELVYLRERRMWFSSFSYTIGNIFLLLLIVLFFFRFVNSNQILMYRQSRMFWVSLGLLIFYLGTFPFFALRNTLYINYKQIFYPYWDATYILASVMYLLFAVAFIWGKTR